MKLVTGPREQFVQRLRQRGATWEQVQPCIVSQRPAGSGLQAEDTITVDVDHPAYPHPHNQRYWPRLARLVAALRKPGETGVGDTLARVFRLIGAKSMAHAYTLLTGEDCGCSQRQRKLNERWPYGC